MRKLKAGIIALASAGLPVLIAWSRGYDISDDMTTTLSVSVVETAIALITWTMVSPKTAKEPKE